MTGDREIRVETDGQVLAGATVSAVDENGDARAEVYVCPGHLPTGTRQRVADAVHEAVTEDRVHHLTATLPLGDAELVEGMRHHLTDVDLRAAGATSIIEGNVRPT
jgi:hypothetical protein